MLEKLESLNLARVTMKLRSVFFPKYHRTRRGVFNLTRAIKYRPEVRFRLTRRQKKAAKKAGLRLQIDGYKLS